MVIHDHWLIWGTTMTGGRRPQRPQHLAGQQILHHSIVQRLQQACLAGWSWSEATTIYGDFKSFHKRDTYWQV